MIQNGGEKMKESIERENNTMGSLNNRNKMRTKREIK